MEKEILVPPLQFTSLVDPAKSDLGHSHKRNSSRRKSGRRQEHSPRPEKNHSSEAHTWTDEERQKLAGIIAEISSRTSTLSRREFKISDRNSWSNEQVAALSPAIATEARGFLVIQKTHWSTITKWEFPKISDFFFEVMTRMITYYDVIMGNIGLILEKTLRTKLLVLMASFLDLITCMSYLPEEEGEGWLEGNSIRSGRWRSQR
jgi:hypothetical protein